MSYVYIASEPGLWTVGFYEPNGRWEAESDHDNEEGAAARVHYLNGGAALTAARDRRIDALVAEVDSWKASYMALAPDHDVAMLRANSRIEALTKALEGTLSWLTSYPGGLPMTPGGAYDKARAALASAAGAEDTNTPKGIQP